MKTKSSKITEGSARKLSSILAVIITAFLAPGGSAQVSSELFWDGASQIPNMVEGGNGFWSNATSEAANWCTDNTGQVNIPWIDGSVAVFQGTAGTVTVTDTIVFGGMIFHTDGYQIVSDGAIDSILQLMGSPTITTDADVTARINATLAGAGGITKDGPGTLILSGANTYLGITAINAGVLSISSDANLGTVPRAPVADQLTFNGGTLQVTDSFALATNRGITLLGGGGTIEVTGYNTFLSYGGVITGAGSLTKTDTGTLVLSGMNTYTGATTVKGGSLIVDGSISSGQTLVNAGGLLGGVGTIGGDLTNSGTVSPGDSPGMLGTLTVNGTYTQTKGGTLRIEIAPTGNDILAINGTAKILPGATLQVVLLNKFEFTQGKPITFLTANTVEGMFPDTGTVIQIVPVSNGLGLEAIPFIKVPGLTPNEKAPAKAVDSGGGTPALKAFLFNEPLGNLPRDFDLIAPEELAVTFSIAGSLAKVQNDNLERVMDGIHAGPSSGFRASGFTIDSRVPDFSTGLAGPTGPEGKSGPSVMQPTPENRWGVSVTGLGEFTSVDDTSITPGYNFSTGGLTFGVDYRVCPNFAIGLTGGYAHTNADLVNNGSLEVDGGTVGAYATGFGGGFYVDAAAFGVFNGYDEHRTALLGTASGNTDGRDFNALVAAGYDWKKGALTIGPTVSYQYTYVQVDGFTEHGSLAPLTLSDQNANSSRTALGAKASYDWHLGHVVVKPELRVAWQHEFGDTDSSIVSRFANGTGNSFTVNGPATGQDSLLIEAGAAVIFNDRVSVYAYYDGELARTNYSSNNVSAGLRFTF